jgi:hypothetical protein
MWFLFFLDFDSVCYPETLVTNLNHVCEIVTEVSEPETFFVYTYRAPMGPTKRCRADAKLTPNGLCEKKSFVVKMEWVIIYYPPREFFMPTKWGAYRFPNLVYTCGDRGKMNGHGTCESAYLRPITKK